MKKTLLASAILASLVSVSSQAATVYEQEGTTVNVYGGAEVAALLLDSATGTAASDNYGYIGLDGTSKISDEFAGLPMRCVSTKDALIIVFICSNQF